MVQIKVPSFLFVFFTVRTFQWGMFSMCYAAKSMSFENVNDPGSHDMGERHRYEIHLLFLFFTILLFLRRFKDLRGS